MSDQSDLFKQHVLALPLEPADLKRDLSPLHHRLLHRKLKESTLAVDFRGINGSRSPYMRATCSPVDVPRCSLMLQYTSGLRQSLAYELSFGHTSSALCHLTRWNF